MKKFKFSILAGIATLGLMTGSCADSFLDVSSKTEPNSGNFYKTEGDAWRALLGCYDGWRQISSNPGIGFYIASTIMSDECYGATGKGDGFGYQAIDGFNQAMSPSDQNLYEQDWKVYYAGVYRCNELISKEAQIAWEPESGNRALYMAECRALRALLYFDMVRLWGNIPLFLEPVNENREQADPADVYNAIVEDLKFAAENIPADANLGVSNNGRITRYAAEAMLARVYLFYTGYYGKELEGLTKENVIGYLDDVVKAGHYNLVPDFKTLWPAASLVPKGEDAWDPELSTYAGEANCEFILQQKFTPSQDYNGNNDSNRWQVMVGMRTLSYSPYLKGWGAATVCPSFKQKYAAGDTRLTASIIDIVGEGVNSSSDYANSVKDWREYTGYCVKKYSPIGFRNGNSASKEDGSADFQIANSQNWVIMRYADVLLMVAELGGVPSKTAQAALDDVRSRAGLPSVPATLDNVLNERALELAFEGIRYWDLLRQGIDKTAAAISASAGPVKTAGVDATVTYDPAKIIATKGLCQIPLNQITLSNGVLKQNAGWEK